MKFDEKILKIYLVAGTQDVKDKGQFLQKVEELLKNGITAFQLREKGINSIQNRSELVILAKQCHELTQKYHIPLIIDDDVDLAIQVGAEGIHVGQKDEQIGSVLNRVGNEMIVGLSCNRMTQVEQANGLVGIDYIGSGTVFETTSKSDAGEAIGVNELHKLVEKSRYPVVAIGGITMSNLAQTMRTGVKGFAAISLFTQMKDPEINMKKIQKIVNA
ncbi:thiamine phosphate synthase [Pediococcus claussenii]|uniref:Thiamine-phosphate synthase n=1 Tax=Pediococcus claussenii (strain ATCC BAA-344 / DSM 14800 / JCM 18046 / KCTC 3811 / LMG 21948 / P06) TaxID=701521 RepID=G8PAI8_PEDCP|nr:thiamine phosphate synthase [Pediococcus claussenii]AEV95777.1 thiamine-phosphate pyrophosphorylase [Pediococcus claussenii ATCC BAA-344]KRN20387.1 thiE protein [Pediococcus claussenii]